ncbi:MAG: hypothetical protein ACXU7D_11225 [Burkholderiaceae bacterium]
MKNINRTFTVIELGKSTSATDIRLPTTDTVEVVDLTTRAILHIKASEVSIYRHTLHWHGKSFNITNISEST